VRAGEAARLRVRADGYVGAELTFSISNAPRHGTAVVTDDSPFDSAEITYTPQPGDRGADSFVVAASDGEVVSQPATIHVEVIKRFVPWLEVNKNPGGLASVIGLGPEHGATPDMSRIDHCLAGIEVWSHVTDTAIVTTARDTMEKLQLFPELMARRPSGFTIIGGVKTSAYIPGAAPFVPAEYDFADEAAWALIAAHASAIVAATGINIVVLENEGATQPYREGLAPVDYEKLKHSLAPLAAGGIEFWWYMPQITYDTPEFPDGFAQKSAFVAAIAEVLPGSKFNTIYTGFFDWVGHGFVEPYRDAMIDVVGLENMNEMLYVTIDGYMGDRYYYNVGEALDALRTVLPLENLNVIYTGSNNWIPAAREFSTLLPHLSGAQAGLIFCEKVTCRRAIDDSG
jgi:hypothetical protein